LAAGAMLGFLYYFTGSLWTVIIYHAVNNFIGVGALYFYSLVGLEDYINGGYDVLSVDSGMIFAVVIYFIISVICAGICVLLFWALKKVTKKPEYNINTNLKVDKIAYLPYFIGGFLMIVIAVLPVVVEMLKS
jgi:membrane protease YdiL (CAAX protease family)